MNLEIGHPIPLLRVLASRRIIDNFVGNEITVGATFAHCLGFSEFADETEILEYPSRVVGDLDSSTDLGQFGRLFKNDVIVDPAARQRSSSRQTPDPTAYYYDSHLLSSACSEVLSFNVSDLEALRGRQERDRRTS
jgi:hypothetical protein